MSRCNVLAPGPVARLDEGPLEVDCKGEVQYNNTAQGLVATPDKRFVKIGGKGELVYKFREPLRWYLIGILLYTIATLALLVWASGGPAFASGKHVLRTGNLKVDQFYSGLALSAFFTPAAILIRIVCNDFAQLHPFSIAAMKPVRTDDLDRMIDIGPFAVKTIFSYSRWHAALQALLMIVGALLVPVGTLIVTTSQYTPQVSRLSFVGMPTLEGMAMSFGMDEFMLYSGSSEDNPTFAQYPYLMTLVDSFKGIVIGQGGLLAETSESLGPVSTANITFEEGVTYDGIVTWKWDAGCEPTNEILYTVDGYDDFVNYTFPDGQKNSSNPEEPMLFLWSDAETKTEVGIAIGGTTYFALSAWLNVTESIPNNTDWLTISGGSWISRVKCSPSLSWEISSCVWDGTSMGKCTAAPNHNTTEIDTVGLDRSTGYMNAALWALYMSEEYLFGLPASVLPLTYYPRGSGSVSTLAYTLRAPVLGDYTNMYGVVAQCIVSASTTGYYGGAMVPTLGQPPQEVYVVRTYILVLVFISLVAVIGLSVVYLAYHSIKRLPFRKTTFLTIANAVRGRWWDTELNGGCVLSPDELRQQNKTKVMFGVDTTCPQHVGLGPVMLPVDRRATYFGLKRTNQCIR